jgi:hypothetical protein
MQPGQLRIQGVQPASSFTPQIRSHAHKKEEDEEGKEEEEKETRNIYMHERISTISTCPGTSGHIGPLSS